MQVSRWFWLEQERQFLSGGYLAFSRYPMEKKRTVPIDATCFLWPETRKMQHFHTPRWWWRIWFICPDERLKLSFISNFCNLRFFFDQTLHHGHILFGSNGQRLAKTVTVLKCRSAKLKFLCCDVSQFCTSRNLWDPPHTNDFPGIRSKPAGLQRTGDSISLFHLYSYWQNLIWKCNYTK